MNCELDNNLDECKFSFNWTTYGCLKRVYFNKKEIKVTEADEVFKKVVENSRKLMGIRIVKSPLKKLIVEGNQEIDLKFVENQLVENGNLKFFDLIISNSKIKSIDSLTFNRITFKRITITKEAANLKYIHVNAFGNGSESIQYFGIRNQLSNNESITILSNSFKNLKEIYTISPNEMKETFKLPNLLYLVIDGSQSTKLKLIDENAFYECDNLRYLNLSDNEIEQITENLFNFRSTSDQLLTLKLKRNKLNSLSFQPNSLSKFNRPVELILNHNEITYLDEIVFKPFLVCDSNKIDLHDNEFLGLENERNRWLGIYKEKKVFYN